MFRAQWSASARARALRHCVLLPKGAHPRSLAPEGWCLMQITEQEVPAHALHAYHLTEPVTHTDCFTCHVAGEVDLKSFILAFYTTPLFRAERLVLRYLARAPATDEDVAALAEGQSEKMAVWTVEARTKDQIVLDAGRTKSWLHVAPDEAGTRLYFGSVVVPEPASRGRPPRLGPVFDTLLGPHKLYSRLLLAAAARRLGRGPGQPVR